MKRLGSRTEISNRIGINDILNDFDVQTVSTGTPQLMIPLNNLEALNKASIKIDEYLNIKKDGDFFSPHLFCLQGITEQGSTFARHFGVPPDTAEDAFTGSASGGMAAYLWNYGLLDTDSFTAEQGHWMGRPGQALVERVGTLTDIQGLKVSGKAVTVMKGSIQH